MTAKFREPHPQFFVDEGDRQKLIDLNTEPFRELLALMLAAKPSLDELKHWAARFPDKWATSLKNIAMCAGMHYQEPTPPSSGITVNLHLMPDSQVLALLAEQQEQLKKLGLQLPFIEAERLETVVVPEKVNAQ